MPPRAFAPALLLASLVALACGDPKESGLERPAATPWAPDRVYAVLINGGGSPRINYYSHLDHLRRLLELLEATGVPRERIAVFSADGEGRSLDLATRDGELPYDFWLLPERTARALRPPIEYVSSRIDGVTLRPALRSELGEWFSYEGSQLQPGDTLLLYVTDHGEGEPDDPNANTITLWGEELSVAELRDLLSLLHLDVRVLMVMSQCHSGGFAWASVADGAEATPSGNVCGYFSATADRKASGCYPEVSGKEALGHSHRLFTALAAGGGLREAGREVLVTDSTPDVPHTTTQFHFERVLERAAASRGRAFETLVDELLSDALRDPAAWEPELRLLDRIGGTFGFASPRSLSGLEQQAESQADLSARLETYVERWERALNSLRQENLRAFVAEFPEWRTRLDLRLLEKLDVDDRRRERDALLEALAPFTEAARDRDERLRDLRYKAEETKAARYRAEVRLGVVLRMRALLVEIAGRHYLASRGSSEQHDVAARLETCEELHVAGLPPSGGHAGRAEPPFPTLADERRRLERLVPGWLGIHYRPPRGAERSAELPGGAAVVSAVLPGSPAAEAGVRVADVVLGPPGDPFTSRHSIREWTMQGEIGGTYPLLLLRDGAEHEAWIRLSSFPIELPELPGPPEVGSPAPPLQAEPLWGQRLPASGRPRLLFFWATWCTYCKRALPDLLAFAEERGVELVAITDEAPEDVERFYDEYEGPLPELVAVDRRRTSFERYGVSGTPTYVLVDASDRITRYWRGELRGRSN